MAARDGPAYRFFFNRFSEVRVLTMSNHKMLEEYTHLHL